MYDLEKSKYQELAEIAMYEKRVIDDRVAKDSTRERLYNLIKCAIRDLDLLCGQESLFVSSSRLEVHSQVLFSNKSIIKASSRYFSSEFPTEMIVECKTAIPYEIIDVRNLRSIYRNRLHELMLIGNHFFIFKHHH